MIDDGALGVAILTAGSGAATVPDVDARGVRTNAAGPPCRYVVWAVARGGGGCGDVKPERG
jgi:hypothetical protein